MPTIHKTISVAIAETIGATILIFEEEVVVTGRSKIYTGMQILAHQRDVAKIATPAVSHPNMSLLNSSIPRSIIRLVKLRQSKLSPKRLRIVKTFSDHQRNSKLRTKVSTSRRMMKKCHPRVDQPLLGPRVSKILRSLVLH